MELLKKLAALFVEQAPRLLSAAHEAVTQRDGKTLERAAHTLKSSVGTFNAHTAFEAAQRLEMIGHQGDFEQAAAVYIHLAQEIARLEQALLTLQ
jgi:HPt (histidine-containing phosphotransfer) domain-containing protein